MCGIFGYIGKKNAAQIVFDGLKILEYRGYDSWGIAVQQTKKTNKDNESFLIEKHTGKIGTTTLATKPLSTSGLESIDTSGMKHIAIGHTRWATHGGVTIANTHPHLDCSHTIALVHNGIVENFEAIRQHLATKNHTFLSQTDTEVIVHLIEEEMKQKSFVDAVRDSFLKLQGMNAIVVAHTTSQEIIAVKNGSPLVIGIGKNEHLIASDALGIIPHTKDVIFLPDNHLAVLGDSLSFFQLPANKHVTLQKTTLDWQITQADKGDFPHFVLKEIHEQPTIIQSIAQNDATQTTKLAEHIKKAYGTFMIGCGTASYAALAGTYLFSTIAKHHINFIVGSEFAYQKHYLTNKTLLIPISQSGETIDVIDPVTQAKEQGVTIAALVNVLGSTLYRLADFPLLLGAGQERAVVATKSFIAMISVLLLTAYTLAGKQNIGKKLLLTAAANSTQLLKTATHNKIKHVAHKIRNQEHIYILGRGLSYATALEAALKIKETSCVHAEGFAGGELKHGVMALIEKGTPCIVYAPTDETFDAIISNAQEVKARGAYIIGIGPQENSVFDVFFPTADCKEATMIPQIVIAQLFAYYLALERGIPDPDKPRNLAKSVTVK